MQENVVDVAPLHRVTLRDALRALTAINQDIQLFNYANVVVRRGYQNLKTVRLLSGGVAGSDLSHAVFVGKGMLTAAILGEDAVPSSRDILHTIKELDHGHNCGVFIIVQGNADVFNFELAVERVNMDCRTRVKLLVVNDDKSDDKDRYSPGFILLVKILGAMAEEGAIFDEIFKFYKSVVNNITTVSMRYSQIPGDPRFITLLNSVEEDCRLVFDVGPKPDLVLQPSIPIVALINTSRSLTRLTELGLVKQVVDKLREWQVHVVRMYYKNFLSGAPQTVSITVLKVTDSRIIRYFDASNDAPGWQQVTQFLPEISVDTEIQGVLQHHGYQPIPLKGPKLGQNQTDVLEKAIQFASDALISCERQLNIIDSERSVGNVGSRFRKLAECLNKRISEKKLPTDCPFAFLKKLGIITEAALGGTVGSIYGILFESAANIFGDLPEAEHVTPCAWARALTYAVNSLKSLCLEEREDSTMIFPIRCCETAVKKEIGKAQPYLQCFGSGVSAAEEAAQATKLKHNQYPDAGAHAVGIWMRAVFEAVKVMTDPENDNK